jgi:hypothetical protein
MVVVVVLGVVDMLDCSVDTHHCSVDTAELFYAYFFQRLTSNLGNLRPCTKDSILLALS